MRDFLSVCKTIRVADKSREIPVIFLTIQGDTEHIVMGFDAGGTDYVRKPFKPELLARIRVQLELKRNRDELKRQKEELEEAIARIRRLEGIIPICSFCKKIRIKRTFGNNWKYI